jgi:hypothetical protein
MKDFFRSVGTALFGWRYVVLTNSWGERKIKRVEFMGGMAFARWLDFDIENVFLLDGGETDGVSYVRSWQPYEPGAERVWPAFSGHRA